MSLYVFRSPLFQRSPRVWLDDTTLSARTSRWYQCLNLGSYCRTVRVSKVTRLVLIRVRRFWFLTRSIILSCRDIAYIDRCHWDVPTAFGVTKEGMGATHVREVWYVRAIMHHTGMAVDLFRFIGEGARMTGWIGILFGGDAIVDVEGMQASKAEAYARLMAEYAGVEYRG